MERKIGETFEFEGKTLQVKADSNDGCEGCIFNVRCTRGIKSVTGCCRSGYRDDKKNVIFVEVQEQEEPEEQMQETEAVKERKVGETFEFEGKKLKVVQTEGSTCYNCNFANRDCDCENTRKVLGACLSETRTDNKPVIFVEIKDETEEYEETEEQPQDEQQPQKLNLCEILKHCPVGEPFWSPMLGDVKFFGIDQTVKLVCVTTVSNVTRGINADGTLTVDDVTSEEVMLYPSREQRDWSKVKYEPKKELPRTWEEFCKNYERKKGDSHIDLYSEICTCSYGGYSREIDHDRNILPSKQAAEAHLAYMQLHQLRDAWREGWVPDWTDKRQSKYVIMNIRGIWEIAEYFTTSRFLAFQDEKRANEFYDCFRDFIEKAGDLI